MKGKYQNGYLPKIEFWQAKYDAAKESGDTNVMLIALDKLTYFVQRQKEVYGAL